MTTTKVMIFSSSFLPKAGGLQYELKWLLDSLDTWVVDQDEFEFSFVYPNDESLEFSEFEHIKSFNLGYVGGGRLFTLKAVLNLRKIIRQAKPDIVHCQSVMPDAGWVYAATLGMRNRPKIVATSHGQDIVEFPEFDYGDRRNRRTSMFVNYMGKRLAAHALPSAALARFADAIGADPGRRHIVPNGMPLDGEPDFEYAVQSGETESESPKNNGGTDGLRYLSLSSGRPIKNLDVLVEAFALALPQLRGSTLSLACVGSYAVHIHELVDRLGIRDSVDFIGEIRGPEKQVAFKSADVYCQVSHFENSPVSLLESMKFGVAVLASNVGGVPEMIEHESNGLLVDQNDVSSVSRALVRMIEEPELRNSLITNGRDVVQGYSMARTIERYADMYRSTL